MAQSVYRDAPDCRTRNTNHISTEYRHELALMREADDTLVPFEIMRRHAY
jgi:hypothetical protein